MDLSRLVAEAPQLSLRGAGLLLRRFTAADVPMAIAHEQDRRIMQWIRDPQPVAAVQARAEALAAPWQGKEGEWLTFVVVPDQVPDQPGTGVGIVVCRITGLEAATVEIGYRLHPDVHRRGLTLASCRLLLDHLFGPIGVRKVIALCATGNEASWRLMERLGMQREACFREYGWLGGALHDEYVYGLLAREWRRELKDAAPAGPRVGPSTDTTP